MADAEKESSPVEGPARPFKVLLVEDSATDARLVSATLNPADFALTPVTRMSEAVGELLNHEFDVVLLDLKLPDAKGLDTLDEVRYLAPDLPVVVMTSEEDEATATAAMQRGAQDYIFKGERHRVALDRSLRYAVERHRLLARLQETVRDLEDALAQVRRLKGLVPMCSWCKKVRNDEKYWQEVSAYISEYTEARVTQSVCPECLERLDEQL